MFGMDNFDEILASYQRIKQNQIEAEKNRPTVSSIMKKEGLTKVVGIDSVSNVKYDNILPSSWNFDKDTLYVYSYELR